MAKNFGSILDFTRQRNEDLMRAYREQLARARFIVMPEIFSLVADSPASRFWVSEERAAVEVSRMLAGKPFSRMRPNKREMFEEIFRRFLIEREKFPEMSLFQLVSRVVTQPAPKFYLAPRTVGEYIYLIKSGWYDSQPKLYDPKHNGQSDSADNQGERPQE